MLGPNYYANSQTSQILPPVAIKNGIHANAVKAIFSSSYSYYLLTTLQTET